MIKEYKVYEDKFIMRGEFEFRELWGASSKLKTKSLCCFSPPRNENMPGLLGSVVSVSTNDF